MFNSKLSQSMRGNKNAAKNGISSAVKAIKSVRDGFKVGSAGAKLKKGR